MRNAKPPDEKQPQGTQSQTAQGDGDPPKYVTEEQLNRAISARFGDFQKKIEKSLGETLGTALGAKLEEFKATLTSTQQQAPQGGQSGGDPQKVDIESHPLFKGMQRQLEEQRKATEQLKTERDAEKARARDAKLRQQLTDRLTAGGVDPKVIKQAVGYLVDADKRVRFADDETDDLVFREDTGDVDFATGLKSWLKSDEAKIYLPPRGTNGSGHRPGSGNAGANGGTPKGNLGVMLADALLGPVTEQQTDD